MYITLKLMVLAKLLKQFIFVGLVWQKCRPITFKFTQQLLTEVLHRHFSRILFQFLEQLVKRNINNWLFCAALINIFSFIVEIAVTIILQIFSQYTSNKGWFHITITVMHQLSIALIKHTYKHRTNKVKSWSYNTKQE